MSPLSRRVGRQGVAWGRVPASRLRSWVKRTSIPALSTCELAGFVFGNGTGKIGGVNAAVTSFVLIAVHDVRV